MILADKIIALRKKAGWSQEELAGQLGVTRQSVSKWEGAQSVPDVDKLLQMSRLFGVTTDYLLKDEQGQPEAAPGAETEFTLRRVSLEQASAYLTLRLAAAPKMALATFLCVVSPVCLILLAGLSGLSALGLSENAAAGIGLCVLLGLVAAGAGLFYACAAKAREFAFLEEEPFETEYGVAGMVRGRAAAFRRTGTQLNLLGIVLCILSALPLFAVMCLNPADLAYVAAVCFLLGLAGVGSAALVYSGTYQGALDKLLEEGEYTRANKARKNVAGTVSLIYWLSATAVFLFYTFGPQGNGQPQYSWFIWAIAGVLYGAVLAAVKLLLRAGEK